MYYINRFPVCALVYKVAGELLGYSENEAKSLGLTRATFFAAAKQGFGTRKSRKTYKELEDRKLDIILFAGLETYITEENGEIRGFFGDKVMEPSRYNSYVEGKLKRAIGEEGLRELEDYFRNKMKDWPTQKLNGPYVYSLYQRERDKVRRDDFFSLAKSA